MTRKNPSSIRVQNTQAPTPARTHSHKHAHMQIPTNIRPHMHGRSRTQSITHTLPHIALVRFLARNKIALKWPHINLRYLESALGDAVHLRRDVNNNTESGASADLFEFLFISIFRSLYRSVCSRTESSACVCRRLPGLGAVRAFRRQPSQSK